MSYLLSPLALFVIFFHLSLPQHAQYDPEVFGDIGPVSHLVDTAKDSRLHDKLLDAVYAAKLDDLLVDKGSFTIFAPSVKAFDALSEQMSSTLFHPENSGDLKAFLTYHIIAGEFTASSILKALCQGRGSALFTTVQGNELLVTMEGIDIVLTDCSGNNARITVADLQGPNRVVHLIDRVIVPHKF